MLGTGVVIKEIRRAETSYIDGQIRQQNQWMGMWNSRSEALRQLESILAEPGEYGISAVLDAFWNSWEDLATSPESLPARIAVVESGAALSERIRRLYSDMREIQSQTDRTIADDVFEINRIANEIAKLNDQIREGIGGGRPNDLLDRRDYLIEELSKLCRIEVYGLNGQGLDCIVAVAGKPLVQGGKVTEMTVTKGANGWLKVVWSDDSSDTQVTGGSLYGRLLIRDTIIEGCINDLNSIAQALVDQVNSIHRTGVDLDGLPAEDFFVPDSDASNIAISPAILQNPSKVAASATGAVGDNTIALSISASRSMAVVNGRSIDDAYIALVSNIGAQTREAMHRAEVHNLSIEQLIHHRDSIAAVSLDEEMANMIKFQQAYNAATRVFTVMNEMLDTLINRMAT
jgi:flagellar hook-associated protein 1 FlgK